MCVCERERKFKAQIKLRLGCFLRERGAAEVGGGDVDGVDTSASFVVVYRTGCKQACICVCTWMYACRCPFLRAVCCGVLSSRWLRRLRCTRCQGISLPVQRVRWIVCVILCPESTPAHSLWYARGGEGRADHALVRFGFGSVGPY